MAKAKRTYDEETQELIPNFPHRKFEMNDTYALPPQTHKIVCKGCNKERVVLKRYTQRCNDCRNSTWYRLHSRFFPH